VGARITLCRISGDRCKVETSLATTTQREGVFEFHKLDVGKYVILYNPSRPSSQVVGLSLDLSDQSLQCLADGLMGNASAVCQGTVPIFGDGDLSLQKQSSFKVSPSGFTLADGSLISKRYGLYLDFAGGEPLSVEIRDGRITETVVKAWDK
jgi:hypothetical protein